MNHLPLSVLAFGAVPDGRTLNTTSLQKAIDEAARTTGHLIIPAGIFRTGTLHLRSNLVLELMPGAVLQGSPDIADYESGRHDTAFNKDLQPFHLLVLDRLDRVTLRGSGTIDGQGPAFWQPIVSPTQWVRELAQRPSPMIQCSHCTNLHIQGIEIANSPGWTLHLEQCERVVIHGISIRNHLYGPNTDGIDIDGCRDVRVSDCLIEAGDDAIVLKTTPGSQSCERVTVTNCVLDTNCRALKLGAYETFHDMRQICFSNCVVRRSVAMFALCSRNGAVLEDIVVSNITGRASSNGDFDQPIHLDLCRHSDDRPRGAIRNVLIQNFVCRTSGRILMAAEPGSWLENISLRDVLFIPENSYDPHPRGLTAGGRQLNPRSPEARAARAALVADRIRNLTVQGFQIDWPASMPAPFHGLWARQVEGGRIETGTFTASDPSLENIHLESSSLRLIP
jgi:polygalacturonase